MEGSSALQSRLVAYSLAVCTLVATPVQAQSLDWSDLTIRNSTGDSLKLSGFASAGLWLQNNSGFGSSKANFDGRTDVFNESGGLLALDGNYGLVQFRRS